jgi:hypothetical protein
MRRCVDTSTVCARLIFEELSTREVCNRGDKRANEKLHVPCMQKQPISGNCEVLDA